MSENVCQQCGGVGATDEGFCTACLIELRVSKSAADTYRSAVGKKGGDARAKDRGFDVSSLPEIRSYADVRIWAEAATRAVAVDAIATKRANSIARLLRQARSALESEEAANLSDLEGELHDLRERIESDEPWKS